MKKLLLLPLLVLAATLSGFSQEIDKLLFSSQ